MIEASKELIKRVNELKRQVFFEIFELVGRVFIIIDYDENVVIGKRGFLPEEKQRGLVLVFNTRMKFQWNEDALTATLIFGNRAEDCYIPINVITGVFSPDLRVHFTAPIFKTEFKETKVISLSEIRKKK